MTWDRAEQRAEHDLIRAMGCACDRHCISCGCGDMHACEGGCAWVVDPLDRGPLCSACLPVVTEALEQLDLDLATLEALELIERHLTDDQEVRWTPTMRGLQIGQGSA